MVLKINVSRQQPLIASHTWTQVT